LLCANKDLMKGAKEYMEHTYNNIDGDGDLDENPLDAILKLMRGGHDEMDIALFAMGDGDELELE
jgi:hypothetical protein